MSADTRTDPSGRSEQTGHSRGLDTFEWPPRQQVPGVDVSALRSRDDQVFERFGESLDASRVPPSDDARSARSTPRLIVLALVGVTLAALVQGAYILRLWSSRTIDLYAGPAPAVGSNRGNSSDSGARPQETADAASVAAGPSTSTSIPATGGLVVSSEPSGADVYIDGRAYGTAPVTIEDMPTGQHRVLVRRGAVEVTQVVNIEANTTASLAAAVHGNTSAAGWIAIVSPVEMEVWEDGALLGTSRSPQIMLSAGTHSLELVNESLEYRHTQQVRVAAGRAVRVDIVLPQGAINLNALPWAEVWIDGTPVGQTPIANLPVIIGSHEVAFRHPDLGEKILFTTVKAGSPARLIADLRQRPADSQ